MQISSVVVVLFVFYSFASCFLSSLDAIRKGRARLLYLLFKRKGEADRTWCLSICYPLFWQSQGLFLCLSRAQCLVSEMERTISFCNILGVAVRLRRAKQRFFVVEFPMFPTYVIFNRTMNTMNHDWLKGSLYKLGERGFYLTVYVRNCTRFSYVRRATKSTERHQLPGSESRSEKSSLAPWRPPTMAKCVVCGRRARQKQELSTNIRF